MSTMFKAKETTKAHLAPKAYIYALESLGSKTFAAISSNDTLTLFTASGNDIVEQASHTAIHKGTTCLVAMGSSLVTAGRDGLIKGFQHPTDTEPTFTLHTPSGKGVSAIAVDAQRRIVAAGTELENDGPGDVQVYIWLLNESTAQPARAYVDSHTDTVTQLAFDPKHPNRLLSSSTDGLINVYDMTIADEDDAVEQAMNNKAAISHFSLDEVASGERIVTCISPDEKLNFYELKDEPDDTEQAPQPWDLREGLKCDYVVKLTKRPNVPGQILLVVGVNKEETGAYRVDVCTLTLSTGLLKGQNLGDAIKPMLRLEGAHADEIVRDIYLNHDGSMLLTGAEDGWLKLWAGGAGLPAGEHPDGEASLKSKKKRDPKKKSEGDGKARFRPY